MKPTLGSPPEAPNRTTRRERELSRREALEARARALKERAEAERRRHASVAALFELVDRDGEVGGGIIAGALAYRLFIWLLPLALVAVAGLGIGADTAHETPEQAASSLGLGGLVTNSVAGAANSSARWYALLVGAGALLLATRSVLRTMIVAHRLVWADTRAAAPRPTATATLKLLGLLVGFFATAAVVSFLHARVGGLGVLGTIAAVVAYAGLWLLVSLDLPHREAPWTALLPGVALFAVGIEVLNVVTAFVIAPYAATKGGTYGALGIAAGLLLGLFLVGRLVVVSAELNATLWEQRRA